MAIDGKLEDWSRVEGRLGKQDLGLLLGNGASRAIWDKFGYHSLYDIACDPDQKVSLSPQGRRIFAEFDSGTRNFDAILSSLATAGRIFKILKEDQPNVDLESIRQQYKNVRNSLIHAVHSIHVPFEKVSDALKATLREIFATFDYVYTTNYDLLLYWSLMDDKEKFKDFFWSQKTAEGNPRVVFNLWDTSVWDKVTKIIYLHGALHLYRNIAGETSKLAGMSGDLLEQFAREPRSFPLFISEGTSKDKVWSIRRNEYLWFAYERFATHRGSMVVFGQSLTPEFDQHIIDAINNWCRYNQRRTAGKDFKRDVAISVYARGQSLDDIAALKLRTKKLLSPHYTLHYFDSASHPLGASSLRINPD